MFGFSKAICALRVGPVRLHRPLAREGSKLDIDAIRRHTPGIKNVVHFNNAGCSLPTDFVCRIMAEYLQAEAEYGGYEAAERPDLARSLNAPYSAIAQLIHCQKQDIAIVSSATAAWQRIFLGLPLWLPGSLIITSVAEYGSNYLAYLQMQKRFGVDIRIIEETPDGVLDLQHLQELLERASDETKGLILVSISHIPTSSGRVYDAVAVGRIVHQFPGVVYLLDACQSVGHMPLDVTEIGCHFLTATGRKYLRAPRGCGFLYVAPEMLSRFEPAALDVRGGTWTASDQYSADSSARRYEEYEMSFAAKAGLGVACEYALDLGMENIWRRVQALAGQLREGLAAIPNVTVQDRGAVLCGIVSFTVEGLSATAIKDALRGAHGAQARWINVSVSSAPSTRLDFDRRSLQDVVRASPHYFNTNIEVNELLSAVELVIEHARISQI